jgi:hypothetical protein
LTVLSVVLESLRRHALGELILLERSVEMRYVLRFFKWLFRAVARFM